MKRGQKVKTGKQVILIIHMRDGSGVNKAESSRGVKRSTSGSIFKIRCGM